MSVVGTEERPSWDTYFLGIAQAVSARADCSRRRVGAVLVDADHRIVSTGYNGSPAGSSLTCDDCPRSRSGLPPDSPYGTENGLCHAIHAEANALIYAGRSRAGGPETVLYSTEEPCHECARLIQAAGVARVVTHTGERMYR